MSANNNNDDRDPFYIGYLPRQPAAVARRTRLAVVIALALALVTAAAVALLQRPFKAAVFEFGVVRSFEGTVRLTPHPTLEVPRPGGGVSRYFLVSPFKFGAEPHLTAVDGQRVRLDGSLIYRDDQTMIELLPDTVQALGDGAAPPAARPVSFGRHALVGEIIDSKCYLGVMQPGHGTVHRACAVRCIAGGIPPVFVLRPRAGAADNAGANFDRPIAYLMLVDADGEPVNDRVLDVVAEPVSIEGEVLRVDDQWLLRADPSTIRRLTEPPSA
ncbi:MAG: hypothetical protein AAF772_08650 [Acidobacteriota bacterium]